MGFDGIIGEIGNALFGKGGEKPEALGREDLSDPNLEHGDELRSNLESELEAVRAREAPQSQAAQLGPAAQVAGTQLASAPTLQRTQLAPAATVDQSQQGQFRDAQQQLVGSLQTQAAGQGPSVASMEAARASGRNVRQQFALSRSGRGGNQGMLARQAARGVADFNQAAAQEAAIGRAREQLAAQQQLAGLTGQARGQDIDLATTQAGFRQQTGLAQGELDQARILAGGNLALQTNLAQGQIDAARAQQQAQLEQQRMLTQGQFDQQNNLANVQAELQARGLDDAAINAYLSQLTGLDQAELAARLQQDQMLVQQAIGYSPEVSGTDQLIGAAQAGAAAYAAKSDRRAKKNITPAKARIRELFESSKGYEYDYKDPEADGHGRQISPMAQDLERSELGAEMVSEGADGHKVVTYNPGTQMAMLHYLYDELETMRGNDG